MGLFVCRRFQRLAREAVDRPLAEREERFVSAHRSECASCRRLERQGALALSMLRMAAIDVNCPSRFELRVMRKWQVSTVHESLSFWSPALIGAVVAGVVLMAALQIVTMSSKLPGFKVSAAEARRAPTSAPAFPELERSTHPPVAR